MNDSFNLIASLALKTRSLDFLLGQFLPIDFKCVMHSDNKRLSLHEDADKCWRSSSDFLTAFSIWSAFSLHLVSFLTPFFIDSFIWFHQANHIRKLALQSYFELQMRLLNRSSRYLHEKCLALVACHWVFHYLPQKTGVFVCHFGSLCSWSENQLGKNVSAWQNFFTNSFNFCIYVLYLVEQMQYHLLRCFTMHFHSVFGLNFCSIGYFAPLLLGLFYAVWEFTSCTGSSNAFWMHKEYKYAILHMLFVHS